MSHSFVRIVSLGLIGCVSLLSGCGGYDGGSGGYATPQSQTANVSLSISPASITQGQSATLTWTASSGTSCTASGAWSGTQPSSGTLSVTPATLGSNTFVLSCSGGGFTSNSATAAISVTAASAFSKSILTTSDGSVQGAQQDPFLINPWGIAFSGTSTNWTADNGSQKATLYDGTGIVQVLVVDVPAQVGGTVNPTGIVFNPTNTDFVVNNGVRQAGAVFLFAGENGSISGWSPTVDGTHAITMYSDASAVFKGLAIANNGTANRLYATDFRNNKVVVIDAAFHSVASPGAFVDQSLPAGYAPFGIQTLTIQNETRVVVTYAKQNVASSHEVAGAGFGIVNVFDVNGVLVKRLVASGAELNAPWGIALAPATFGTLSNSLLVGNAGSGVVHAYDPVNGTYLGAIRDSSGAAIATPGLHGIAFGNGARNQSKGALYFFSGINAETGGVYGRIDLGATAPDVVAPTVRITTPASGSALSGTVPIVVNAHDNVGVAQLQFLAGTTVIGTLTNVPDAPATFNWNSTTVPNGGLNLTARATDAAGNVTTSVAVDVTIANP